jgi:hypothetical protein
VTAIDLVGRRIRVASEPPLELSFDQWGLAPGRATG